MANENYLHSGYTHHIRCCCTEWQKEHDEKSFEWVIPLCLASMHVFACIHVYLKTGLGTDLKAVVGNPLRLQAGLTKFRSEVGECEH